MRPAVEARYVEGIACLILAVAISAFFLTSCTSDPAGPAVEDQWQPLGLFSDAFNSTVIQNDTLYASAAVSGIHQRTPVRTGTWSEIGFTFPGLIFEGPDNGASSLTVAGSELLVGFRGVSGFPQVVRVDRDSVARWFPSDTGLQRGRVYEILQTGTSTFIATTSHSFYRSSDNGMAWTQVFFRIAESATFSQTGSRIYAAGRHNRAVLAYSDNQGFLWHEINVTGKMTPHPSSIYSVERVNETELLVSADTGTFWSPDSGASFINVLSTATNGKVLVNPDVDGEVIVVADSVYHSPSVPGPWTSWPLPGRRMPVAAASADWKRRHAVIPILEHDAGQLYLFRMPGTAS